MRILFVIDNLGGGGAQKLISDIVQNIKGEKCELLLLSNKSDKYCSFLKEKGFSLYIIPDKCKSFLSKLNYMWKIICKGNYSIIHANLFPAIYYVAIIKRIHKKSCPPVILTEHSTDNKRRHKIAFKLIEKFIYGSYDHIISISNETQEALLGWLGKEYSKEYFSVIENGIDVRSYQKACSYEKNIIFPEYKNGDRLIGMVGSFTPQKNHITMIEAMTLLPNEYKLILIGEGLLFERIKKLVIDKNLSSRIVFLGFRKDIASIIKSVDIICIPSIWEGFGLVAVESMAAGTPVVAANVKGLANVVGGLGITFDPNNADSIAKAIVRTLNNFDDEFKKLLNDRSNQFDIVYTAKEYNRLFEQIANQK